MYVLFSVGHMTEQKQMADYLKEKYGKEFVVNKPERKASGLGVEGYLQSTAYPKDDTSLTFDVWTSSTETNDEYPGAVWQREESKRLTPLIEQAFGDHIRSALEIVTAGTTRGDINISGTIPAFDSASKKYGNKILYKLQIQGEQGSSEDEKVKIANAILALRENLPIEQVDVVVDYYANYTDSNNNTYKSGLSVSGKDLAAIQSPEKLVSQFNNWRIY